VEALCLDEHERRKKMYIMHIGGAP